MRAQNSARTPGVELCARPYGGFCENLLAPKPCLLRYIMGARSHGYIVFYIVSEYHSRVALKRKVLVLRPKRLENGRYQAYKVIAPTAMASVGLPRAILATPAPSCCCCRNRFFSLLSDLAPRSRRSNQGVRLRAWSTAPLLVG